MLPRTASLPGEDATAGLRAFAVQVDEEHEDDLHTASNHTTPETSPQQQQQHDHQLRSSLHQEEQGAGRRHGPAPAPAGAAAAASLIGLTGPSTTPAAPAAVAAPPAPAAAAGAPPPRRSAQGFSQSGLRSEPATPPPAVPVPMPAPASIPAAVPRAPVAAGIPIPIASVVPAGAAADTGGLFGTRLNLPGVSSPPTTSAATTPAPVFLADLSPGHGSRAAAAAALHDGGGGGGEAGRALATTPGSGGAPSPAASSLGPPADLELPLTAPRPHKSILLQRQQEESQLQPQPQPLTAPPVRQALAAQFSPASARGAAAPAAATPTGGSGGFGAAWPPSWSPGGGLEVASQPSSRDPLVPQPLLVSERDKAAARGRGRSTGGGGDGGRGGAARRRERTWWMMSYAFDWLLAAALLAFDFTVPIKTIHPINRYSTPGDPALSYPRRPDTVPVYVLAILCLGVPAVVFAVVALARRRLVLLHHGLLALVEGMALLALLKHTLNLTGVYRPDWFANLATGDPRVISDGRLAYPSGHAGFSATAASLTALFLAGQTGLLAGARRMGQFALALLCGVPLGAAAFVAATRVVDHKHAPADINAGAALGLLCGAGAYLLNFHSPLGRLSEEPRLHGTTVRLHGGGHAVPHRQRRPNPEHDVADDGDSDVDGYGGDVSSGGNDFGFPLPHRRRQQPQQYDKPDVPYNAMPPGWCGAAAAEAPAESAGGAPGASSAGVGVGMGLPSEPWDIAERGGGTAAAGAGGSGGGGSAAKVGHYGQRPLGGRPR